MQSSEVTQRLDSLETASKRIVQILTFTQSWTKSSASPYDLTKNSRSMGKDTRREKVLRVILGLEDGTTLSVPDQDFVLPGQDDSPLGNSIERVITFRGQSNTWPMDTISNERFSPLATKVLALLHYRGLQNRFDDTAQAHHETYEWIFTAPEKDRHWSDFAEWLRRGDDLYWISGKPGSGKSTLMKYIYSNPKTTQFLNIWRGGSVLLKAGFFFWAAGTTMQSSQEGLLRGLLYTLLAQCPRLIPSVFSDICTEILEGHDLDPSWTIPELTVALRLLIKNSEGLKICIFIDGLDEYSGDHENLIRMLGDLSFHESVKLVVSSRPWVQFTDAFDDMPRLLLQNLTYRDIEKFVTDSLITSRGLQEINELKPELYSQLVHDLCYKSDGVFLWVRLALLSILQGLQQGDSVLHLQERLQSLPTDLESMYRMMLDSLTPSAQTGAARIILLMLRSKEMPSSEPMSLLQLALAEDEDITAERAINEEARVMSPNMRRALCSRMRRRIDGQTKGLLEVTNTDHIAERGSSYIDAWVGFFHRTAIDFFRLAEIWELLKTRAGSNFNTDLTLLVACLREMKVLPAERAVVADADRCIANMRQGLMFASFLEDRNLRPYTALLDDMERTMRLHWQRATMFKKRALDDEWTATKNMTFDQFTEQQVGTELRQHHESGLQPSFLSLAMSYGCYLYVADKASWEEAVTAQQRTSLTKSLLQYYLKMETTAYYRPGTKAATAILKILDMDAEAFTRMDLHDCWHTFTTQLFLSGDSVFWAENANNTMDLCLAFLKDRSLRLHSQFDAATAQSVLQTFHTRVLAANSPTKMSNGTQQDLDEFNTKYEEAQSLFKKEVSTDDREDQEWPMSVWLLFAVIFSVLVLKYDHLLMFLGG